MKPLDRPPEKRRVEVIYEPCEAVHLEFYQWHAIPSVRKLPLIVFHLLLEAKHGGDDSDDGNRGIFRNGDCG